MFDLSSLYVKLIGGVAAALVVLGLFLGMRHYRNLANERGDKLAAICQTTRTASGNPKLKCADVPQQIQLMGEAIGTLTTAVNRQNAAVDAMGAETARQQAQATEAVSNALGRAQGAQDTATRLIASSRSGGPSCEASKALQNAWK